MHGPGPAALAAAAQGMLFNADPSLLLSPPSSPLSSLSSAFSIPFLCRMFPNSVRCLQYRYPTTSFGGPISRADPGEPALDFPEAGTSQGYPHQVYQYVLLSPPVAVQHQEATLEPCRLGNFFNMDEGSITEQQQQQQQQAPQKVKSPCPAAGKITSPQPSTQEKVVKQVGNERSFREFIDPPKVVVQN